MIMLTEVTSGMLVNMMSGHDMLPIMVSLAFSSMGIMISKRCNRLKPDIVEALQFLKCVYRCDLLFHEEPSTMFELNIGEYEDLQKAVEDDAKNLNKGWDGLIEDLGDDEGFVDYDGDDVFMQEIA